LASAARGEGPRANSPIPDSRFPDRAITRFPDYQLAIGNIPLPLPVYRFVDSLLSDLRYAIRSLVRRPAFSALAIVTLAVGIGVNGVAFSAVSALLFKPFSFPGAERLAWIMSSSREDPHGQISWASYDVLQHVGSFDEVAAEARTPLAWQNGVRSQQVWALLVTANYFTMLGTQPHKGRLFVRADASGPLTILVSQRFWRTHFDAPFSERTMELNGQIGLVVGLVPDRFQGPGGLYEPDLWVPLEQARNLRLVGKYPDAREPVLTVVARLRDGVTPAQARAALNGIARGVQDHVASARTDAFALHPLADGHPELRGLAPIVWLALSVVGVVLLIACFNVASLLLARASERRREISMRAALGASRARIVRQLLTEGAVLSIIAGAAAVALAGWSGRLLAVFSLPSPIPQRLHMGIDARVVGFTLAMVVVATLLPSLLPAWHATRQSAIRMHEALTASGRKTRNGFVIAQIVGSTIFVTAALLFVRSFWNAASLETGFDTRHVVVAELSPFLYGYDASRTELLAEAARARISALEGVASVSIADRAPYGVGFGKSELYSLSGDCSINKCPGAAVYRVGPAYLRTLGIPLREGRELTREDGESRVVVSARMAAQLWPGRSAIGQVLRLGKRGAAVEVVGVTGDVKLRNPSENPSPVIYRPWRGDDAREGFSVLVRTADDAPRMLGTIRDAVATLNRAVPIQLLQTMRERMAVPLWPSRTLAGFFAICGVLSLLLATVGLFGVTFYLVQQRTREFGVRIALGASRERIMRAVLGEGTRVALVGTMLGAAGAYIAARVLSRALVDISAADPLSYAATAALQIVVALAACALPAWRASRANPIEALRGN
jgi:macrolide transport system ATP-binding/permease protein